MAIYKETQKINQWWMQVLLLGIAALPIWTFFKLHGSGQPYEEVLLSSGFLTACILPALVILLFLLLTLTTEVTAEGIRVKYFPLWGTRIAWDEVRSAEIIQYGFVGYGIRLSFEYGVVYNAKGNKGLQILKKSGDKVLIGTQHPDDLNSAVQKFLLNNEEQLNS